MANFTRNFIKGKMNKDVDERLVPNGEYIDALNVRMGSTETSEIGVIENSLGNNRLTAITYLGNTLSGDALTIGAYEDGANETIYWFITDPSFTSSTVTGKLDLVLSYNTRTGITTYHIISIWDGVAQSGNTTLNFNPTYLITGVDLVEDLLLFTDDYNNPREINVTRTYPEPANGSSADGIVEEDIMVIKRPPAESPTILETTTGGEELFLEDRFICFAYRYRYRDNEYSATSQWSQPAFFPRAFNLSPNSQLNEGMLNLHNSVRVTYNSGSSRVVGVDLLFKDMGNSIIKVIERLDKVKEGLVDNAEYNYQFTNSKIFTILSEAEILRLYDNVPRLAQAQTIMGNRLVYGNYVEGYDLIDRNGDPTNLEYITTLISEEIGAEGFTSITQSSDYEFDLSTTPFPYTVLNSSVTFDFTTLEDSLTEGSSLSITITFDHSGFTGAGAPPIDTTQPEDINFVFVLTQDYDSIFELSESDEFLDQIGTLSNILPVYDAVNPTSCDGVTFTDQFNCVIPSFLLGTPSYVKYASGIDGPEEPIRVISSEGSSEITLQLPAMRWVDDPTAIVDDVYEYYEILSSSATFKAISNPKSLHSNRGYEVGILYMDDFRRATTALVSPYNTVHVPCSASDLQNRIQIDIPVSQIAPEWATRYKFVIKPDKEGYETIYTSFYFQDPSNNDTWFLIDGENAAKVEIGDRYIVKVDSDGPKNQCASTVVLDKVAQPANFIDNVPLAPDSTENLYQPQGVYMRMDTSNFNAIRDISQTIIQPSRVEVSNLGPVTNLYRLTNAIFPPPPAPPVYEDYLLPALSLINIEVVFRRQPSGSSCTKKDYTYERQFTVGANYASIEDWFYAEGFGSTLNSGTWDTDGGPESNNVWIGNTATTLTELTTGSNTTNYWQLFRNADTLAPNYNALYLTVSGPPACGIFGSFYLTSIIGIKVDVILAGSTIVFETEPTDASPDIWFENEQSFEVSALGDHYGDPNNPDDVNQDIATNVAAIINTTFFNCWSFGNGVESYKIRDSILGRDMNLGNRVTSTQAKDYKEIRRYADLTYSGIYNEESNINKLNEFNLGLSNFKPLEISFGYIQKLFARESDILVLQEDKISYVLGGKNLLSDLGAGNLLTATPEVLGTQIARIEEFGISQHPESFSVWGPDKFFTDAKRGVLLHLKGSSHANEQLVVISKQGMNSWFRDLFIDKFNTQKLGGYDPYMNEYVLGTNERLLPTDEVCIDCGSTFDITVYSGAAWDNCVDVGQLVGDVVVTYTVLSVVGTFLIKTTYNGIETDTGQVGVSGTHIVDKNEPAISSMLLEVKPTDEVSLQITVACPDAKAMTVILVTLSGPTNAGLFIHNEYRWNNTDYLSPLQSNQIEFVEGDVNPVLSQYEVFAGLQGEGAIPTDDGIVTMYYHKIGFDNYDFDILRDTFKYHRTNTLYGPTAVEIDNLVAASTDATPIVIDNAPLLYSATYNMNTTPPFPNGDYLYMIWDYRVPAALDPFIFSILTSGAAEDFILPLKAANSDYDFVVDWGDNTTTAITLADWIATPSIGTHTYATAGLYIITITGTCVGWNFNNSTDAPKVQELINWGDFDAGVDGSSAFYGCTSMVVTAQDVAEVSSATSLSRFFLNCSSITTIPAVNDWEVSNCTDMQLMFANCVLFNDDLSEWDVSNVTNFTSTFENCSVFNTSLNNWNPTDAVTMRSMFEGCIVFNKPLDNWDVHLAGVTDMSFMFYLCREFNQNINSWSTYVSDVQTMESMFESCIVFNQPLDSWITTSLTNLQSTFENCSVFNQTVDSWDVSNVTNMILTFSRATVFDQPLNTWQTGECLSMSQMFSFASAFGTVYGDLSLWDTSKVTDFYRTFNFAISFNGDVTTWDTISATRTQGMFFGATVFNRDIDTSGGAWITSSVTDMKEMFRLAVAFDQNLNTWDTGAVLDMSGIFRSATVFGLANGNISSWNTANVTTLESSFYSASSFNGNIGSWNTSSCTTLLNTFNAAVVFNQDISSWDTSSVTLMRRTFASATSYDQPMPTLGVQWDVSNVTDMSFMFQNAVNFDQPLSTWIVANVTTMRYMFGSVSAPIVFNQDISGWNVGSVIDMAFMFQNAVNFDQPIGSWNVIAVTDMQDMFDNAAAFDQDLSAWLPNNVANFVNFLGGTAVLSTANYNALLNKLSTILVQPNIIFDAPNCIADAGPPNGLTAIAVLESPTPIGDDWTINDAT